MSRDRYDVLERYEPLFEVPEHPFERFLGRRDRKRRNQRIAAGVVGMAVFVATVWLVATEWSADRTQTPAVTGPTGGIQSPDVTGPAVPNPGAVGFIGLPPEGATPSTPRRGELVLSLYGRSPAPGEGLDRIWVYADGRIVWDREGLQPGGANSLTTGLLEQRLTSEGVELLRSELIATGLFEHDAAFVSDVGAPWLTIEVRDGDRFVRVYWSWPAHREGEAVTPTPEQRRALERADALLTDPASTLPASAWEDVEIRGYVASRYAVCYQGLHEAVKPSRILNLLPAVVADRLRAMGRTRYDAGNTDAYCSEVTTEEARTLVDALDDAEQLEAYGDAHRLEYVFDVPDLQAVRGTVLVFFEPYLPHGEFLLCSPCR